jgi:hypothetical protein
MQQRAFRLEGENRRKSRKLGRKPAASDRGTGGPLNTEESEQ